MSHAPHDQWQIAATHRLRQHVMRASLRGRDYAPDSTYEQIKRGHSGPHSLAIAATLQRWADMWAQDMREAQATAIDVDAQENWQVCMSKADAEIDRYLANNHLVRAA